MIDKILKDVLDTAENEWNYFFLPHRIKGVLTKLANQIQTENFFTSSYSINKFLDFLKTYVTENLNHAQLDSIDIDILRKFNRVSMALQERIINHTTGLDESQQKIISNYLIFLRQLMEHNHRNLFANSEIKLNSSNLQAIAGMLTVNSASINADLIHQYISLLRLSFDVPELLVKYKVGLNILPLAKACFLNKNIDVHVAATQFFYVLGYQGQLLDYYKNNPRFNITEQLLKKATNNLKDQAIALQKYFFNNLNRRDQIDKPLLQHYLYVQFFKVIYKENPTQLDALKTDTYLSSFIKLDFVALSKSNDCRNYLSADNKVIIEYNNLDTGISEIACEAIACSSKSYEQWQRSLGFHPTTKSRYIFRVGDSYENYSFTYAYGESPKAGGFYLAGKIKNNTVNGIAYSYFGDKHQFIDVARHEEAHHKNFRLQFEAQKSNADITSLTNRNFNEGLAVLFAGGACAPGYGSKDFSNITAPNLETLLNSKYIGYSTSWLYNNYFIQEYPSFYHDLLRLDKSDFKEKWTSTLNQSKDHFVNWLPYLKQACKDAPKELSTENCPSIYLKDYLSPAELQATTIKASQRTSRKSMPQITSRTTAALRSSKQMPVPYIRPDFYDDYFHLMHAIFANNATEIDRILRHTNYPIASIVNFRDPERGSQTPLYYALVVSGKKCSELVIQTLRNFGALPDFINDRNTTAYDLAKYCDNESKIVTILDNRAQNLNHETGLIPYQQQKLALTIGIPISALVSGGIAGVCEEIAQRNSKQYPYLPNIIFYGLKPTSIAIGSAVMNTLMAGPAEYVGLEDAWLSFAYYLGMNYLGLMLAQLGERASKKIQNKLLNILMPILLYTFFINPSLLITLMSEGFGTESLQAVMMPLLSMLSSGILFKAGEYGTQKAIGKFFPVNSALNTNKSYIQYKIVDINDIWDEKLGNFKNNYANLKVLFVPLLKTSAHKLIFSEDLNLLKKFSEVDTMKQIDDNPDDFNNAFSALAKIKENLSNLDKAPNKKNILAEITNNLVPTMNAIRPPQQVINARGGLAQNKGVVTDVEEQRAPLMTTFIKETANFTRTSKLPQIFSTFKPTDLPAPPTEEELWEIKRYE